jgi:hypothetical protein
MARTLEEIRQAGLEALRQRLGRAGMVRFLQQFDRGSGDYARERQSWVDRTSLDALRSSAGSKRRRKSGRRG